MPTANPGWWRSRACGANSVICSVRESLLHPAVHATVEEVYESALRSTLQVMVGR
jgi:hypothetical protein